MALAQFPGVQKVVDAIGDQVKQADHPCAHAEVGVAARVGGAGVTIGAMRVTFWGALAMAITAGVGALFETAV